MDTAKICASCMEHFNLARSDLVEGIQKLKRQALEDAIKMDYDDADIQVLQNELQRYKYAASLEDGGGVPCPWNSSQPVHVSFRARTMLPVWNMDGRSRPFAHLRESSESTGCQACESLVSMVNYVFGHQVSDSVRITSVWILEKGRTLPSMLQFRVYPDEECSRLPMVLFFFCTIDGLENGDLDLGDDNSLSDTRESGYDSLEFLTQNFKTCIRDHAACDLGRESSWIPTRLLNVQPAEHAPSRIALVDRADINAITGEGKAEYLTLSHVWGFSIPSCLTKSNYLDMKTGVLIDTLPACYRDAVHIARKLGIQYLWIDSLCILQDSIEDWEREAMTMDRVYTNAVCNIAACDTRDSHDSILASHNFQHGQALRIRSKFMDGTATFNIIPNWVRLIRTYAPLYKRGWVVQERFLSKRVVHFSRIPIWECTRALLTPTYRQEMLLVPDYQDFWGTERGWLTTHTGGVHIVLSRWLHLVEIYCRCGLTFSDDKLIALSGLAKLFAPLLQEDYYAGIWGGSHVVQCLLWTPVGERSTVPRSTYLAPSWSWACIDGPVQMTHKFSQTAQVLSRDASIQTTPKTCDTFGQVTAGELRLKGLLFEIQDIGLRLERLTMGGQCRLDYSPPAKMKEKTYFLPLAKVIDQDSLVTFQGLFVQEAVMLLDLNEPKFQRIGMGTIRDVREVDDGSKLCNILDDMSWKRLQFMSRRQTEEDMQTIIII